MRVGSLFSGIGGLELGLEAAGMQTAWQVERDPYACRVLAKHWPDVPRYDDVRTFRPATAAPVDLVCGGFPCQPHSVAGKRLASADDRDLWGEFARIIGEANPRWVVGENVPGLLSSEGGRYFGRILADLAALGFNAEWFCLSAQACGAPHRRERLFIVAHANSKRQQERNAATRSGDLGHNTRRIDQGWREGRTWWRREPDVGRVVNGFSARVDRLRCLGNAVVPQVAYVIGKRIMEAESLC